jgi:tetratricopeptide (TPR) repeat protein
MTRRTVAALLLVTVVGVAVAGATRWLKPDEREVTTSSNEAYECYREGLANTTRFRLEQAYDCFAKAVEIDPEFAVGHMRLALAARELGRTEAYEEHLARAIEKRQSASEIEQLWIERLQAVVEGDHQKGKKIYEQMEALYPDHRWVLRLKAEFAKMNGKYEEALEAYNRILEQDPEAVDIHYLKGYLFLSQGEYEEAVQSLQRYAFYAPDQANPHDSLGEAYMSVGRYEESIHEFKQALEIDETFVWSGVHRSEVLAITGQFEKAQHVLNIVQPVFEERGWDNWLVTQRMKIDYLAED